MYSYRPEQMTCFSIVKGLAMDNTIYRFIDNLISTYGYKTSFNLSEGDREEIVALLIEDEEPMLNEKIIPLFKKSLTATSILDDMMLVAALKKNAVKHYSKQIEELFDEVMAERKAAIMHKNNFTSFEHPDNGERGYHERLY